MKYFFVFLFSLTNVFAQESSYSSANQDTEVNSRAPTQNDNGYQNRDIEKQEAPMSPPREQTKREKEEARVRKVIDYGRAPGKK